MPVNSVAMIVPAAHVPQLEQLGQALGYEGVNWSVPLSPSGNAPATHYGAHVWEQPGGQFWQLRQSVLSQTIPPELAGFSEAMLSIQFRTVEGSEHSRANWDALLSENSLMQIQGG